MGEENFQEKNKKRKFKITNTHIETHKKTGIINKTTYVDNKKKEQPVENLSSKSSNESNTSQKIKNSINNSMRSMEIPVINETSRSKNNTPKINISTPSTNVHFIDGQKVSTDVKKSNFDEKKENSKERKSNFIINKSKRSIKRKASKTESVGSNRSILSDPNRNPLNYQRIGNAVGNLIRRSSTNEKESQRIVDPKKRISSFGKQILTTAGNFLNKKKQQDRDYSVDPYYLSNNLIPMNAIDKKLAVFQDLQVTKNTTEKEKVINLVRDAQELIKQKIVSKSTMLDQMAMFDVKDLSIFAKENKVHISNQRLFENNQSIIIDRNPDNSTKTNINQSTIVSSRQNGVGSFDPKQINFFEKIFEKKAKTDLIDNFGLVLKHVNDKYSSEVKKSLKGSEKNAIKTDIYLSGDIKDNMRIESPINIKKLIKEKIPQFSCLNSCMSETMSKMNVNMVDQIKNEINIYYLPTIPEYKKDMTHNVKLYTKKSNNFSYDISKECFQNWIFYKEVLITGINFSIFNEFQEKHFIKQEKHIRAFWIALLGDNFENFAQMVAIYCLKMDTSKITEIKKEFLVSLGDFLNVFISKYDRLPFLEEDYKVVYDTLNHYLTILNHNIQDLANYYDLENLNQKNKTPEASAKNKPKPAKVQEPPLKLQNYILGKRLSFLQKTYQESLFLWVTFIPELANNVNRYVFQIAFYWCCQSITNNILVNKALRFFEEFFENVKPEKVIGYLLQFNIFSVLNLTNSAFANNGIKLEAFDSDTANYFIRSFIKIQEKFMEDNQEKTMVLHSILSNKNFIEVLTEKNCVELLTSMHEKSLKQPEITYEDTYSKENKRTGNNFFNKTKTGSWNHTRAHTDDKTKVKKAYQNKHLDADYLDPFAKANKEHMKLHYKNKGEKLKNMNKTAEVLGNTNQMNYFQKVKKNNKPQTAFTKKQKGYEI